ncbi:MULTISPECIES: nucleoside recognition domain-containing protein [unclassified Clostridioides]|uniref:spore maturation protein n=1 Tax=unclassified Clostridioides TaxID=2635829 RepID=UPI001D109B77|nr:spore maturation protein [Clostridioides sp. ZZV14-6150]MCC0661743.1 spore maturation protein [Clostridioides sp. ZZV14-6154]MCC0669548.1 spore maturation protein [Clostridioides sp. ZZV14-6153]MCC0719281.1 spore maturation protein [Clostridioides sp. ZZV14-6105]MCC0723530.1 spore maturation protein [Clostridioides sp. ZZV14-6104]MCC0727390.1 spore maturation protein [Clostridioides sp. ZZV14-6045]MCC0731437.1 spore maturation protein [Clostridioides sp. ZZV14-6048]MCC0735754.1 spore matu
MEVFSNLLIPVIILYIVVYGKYKKIDVYDSFVKGAIDGLKAAWDILPYIIGIFLAIGIFKTGKGLDMLEWLFTPIANMMSIPKELIGLISVKPLSGSGALGMYSELANRVGIGSLVEKMGATIVGSSETIFYTMAIYYGSLKIKNTRHTLSCAMISHVAGVIAAVFICYVIFV